MSQNVGIVGAGILGRLTALEFLKRGHHVTLFDRGGRDGRESCSWVAAGMLSPHSELEHAEAEIDAIGRASLELWPSLIGEIDSNVFFQAEGGVVIAPSTEPGELDRFSGRILKRNPNAAVEKVCRERFEQLEPELADRFDAALYLPMEGQVETREVLPALATALESRGAKLRFETEVKAISVTSVATDEGLEQFDYVIDTRGLAAKDHLPSLRGVRGEILRVHAPEVDIRRMVRFQHSRLTVYVIPRRDRHYLIGATCLETEDQGPVTVRSMLELLSGGFAVHSGFAEAKILETMVQCRPAFMDNRPRILNDMGVIRANGLFRNGYLLSPKLSQLVVDFALDGKKEDSFEKIYEEPQG